MWKDRFQWPLILCLVAIAAGPITVSVGAERQTIQALAQERQAPQVILEDLNGKQHELADYKGKVVAVNFWATWCPPCRKELPSMQHTYERLQDDGLEILAVNVGEDWDTVAPFLENFSVEFPVLLDKTSEVIGEWDVLGLPTTFIVDREGRISHRISGGRDWDDPFFRKQLRDIVRAD